MMAERCYVYAIVRREAHIPPSLAGLADAPLAMASWQNLAAITSPIASTTLPATPDFLLRHEAVVEALGEAGPTLPARFGAILASPTAVVEAIAEQYETLLADLARVGDKVELGLTVLWPADAQPIETPARPQIPFVATSPANGAPGAGRHYLEARLAHYQREINQQSQTQAVIAQLEQALEQYPLERRYRILSGPRLAIRAAYLLERRQIPDIQRVVDQMRHRLSDLRWLLSGPWPPYSFVTRANEQFHERVGLEFDRSEGKLQ